MMIRLIERILKLEEEELSCLIKEAVYIVTILMIVGLVLESQGGDIVMKQKRNVFQRVSMILLELTRFV